MSSTQNFAEILARFQTINAALSKPDAVISDATKEIISNFVNEYAFIQLADNVNTLRFDTTNDDDNDVNFLEIVSLFNTLGKTSLEKKNLPTSGFITPADVDDYIDDLVQKANENKTNDSLLLATARFEDSTKNDSLMQSQTGQINEEGQASAVVNAQSIKKVVNVGSDASQSANIETSNTAEVRLNLPVGSTSAQSLPAKRSIGTEHGENIDVRCKHPKTSSNCTNSKQPQPSTVFETVNTVATAGVNTFNDQPSSSGQAPQLPLWQQDFGTVALMNGLQSHPAYSHIFWPSNIADMVHGSLGLTPAVPNPLNIPLPDNPEAATPATRQKRRYTKRQKPNEQ